MKITFDAQTLDLTPAGRGKSYHATLEDKAVDVEVVRVDSEHGKLDLLIDGEHITAHISSDGVKRWVTINGQTVVLTKSSGAQKGGHAHHHTAGELTAPMPGQVRSVNVSEGETVMKGQTLIVLEAMKMEIRIQSPRDGTVGKLFVQQGNTVEREQTLIEIEDS